ncbi:hypothetical protein [Aquimarina hainanensis]|uniref:hypothetical protein n=1 Tax=Aquimarina hainanensis TaxID=1578017 RepID=UPI003619201C
MNVSSAFFSVFGFNFLSEIANANTGISKIDLYSRKPKTPTEFFPKTCCFI